MKTEKWKTGAGGCRPKPPHGGDGEGAVATHRPVAPLIVPGVIAFAQCGVSETIAFAG